MKFFTPKDLRDLVDSIDDSTLETRDVLLADLLDVCYDALSLHAERN